MIFLSPKRNSPGMHWERTSTHLIPEPDGYSAVNDATNMYYVVSSNGAPDNSTIFAFNGADNSPAGSFDTPPIPQTMAVDETTNHLYIPIWGPSFQVQKVNLADFTDVQSVSEPDWVPYAVALNSTGSELYVIDGGDAASPPAGTIKVVDTATMTITSSVDIDPDGVDPAYDPVHDKLFVPIEGGFYVLVYDTVNHVVLGGIYPATPNYIVAAAIDPALNRVVTANASLDPTGFDSVTVIDSSV